MGEHCRSENKQFCGQKAENSNKIAQLGDVSHTDLSSVVPVTRDKAYISARQVPLVTRDWRTIRNCTVLEFSFFGLDDFSLLS